MLDYVINFVNHFDPNGNTVANWPQYTPSNPTLLTLLDGASPVVLTNDTFRAQAIEYLTELTLASP